MEHETEDKISFIPWFCQADYEIIFMAIHLCDPLPIGYDEWAGKKEEELKAVRLQKTRQPYVVYINPDHFFKWIKDNNLRVNEAGLNLFGSHLTSEILGIEITEVRPW